VEKEGSNLPNEASNPGSPKKASDDKAATIEPEIAALIPIEATI